MKRKKIPDLLKQDPKNIKKQIILKDILFANQIRVVFINVKTKNYNRRLTYEKKATPPNKTSHALYAS